MNEHEHIEHTGTQVHRRNIIVQLLYSLFFKLNFIFELLNLRDRGFDLKLKIEVKASFKIQVWIHMYDVQAVYKC